MSNPTPFTEAEALAYVDRLRATLAAANARARPPSDGWLRLRR